VSTPPELKWLTEVLGWCAKAVDSLADRILFREFRDDNLGMNEIYQMNNIDILPDSAVLSALISSCAFIYISPDDNGFPRLQVIDGGNATGVIDPITGLLKEGYAVLKRDSCTDQPVMEAYMTPDRTDIYINGKPKSYKNPAGIPLLVPIVFRPDAAQQSVQPHIDQLRMFASAFAGETGLTLDDLGFPSNNPSSADAIRSTHENLRLVARKAQRTFGSGFLNAGYVAACLRDEYHYKREVAYMTRPIFEPIFEPDATMLAGIGDAVGKINQAVPDYMTNEKLRDLTGI